MSGTLNRAQVVSWREGLPQFQDLTVRLTAQDHTIARVRSLATVEIARRMGDRETDNALLCLHFAQHSRLYASWSVLARVEALRTIEGCVRRYGRR